MSDIEKNMSERDKFIDLAKELMKTLTEIDAKVSKNFGRIQNIWRKNKILEEKIKCLEEQKKRS